MKCEICGRDSREVARTALRQYQAAGGAMFQGLPNPYPGPLPEGDGRGWVVVYDPARRYLTEGPGHVFAALSDVDLSAIKRFDIGTCGGTDCLRRAKHGIPGRKYSTGSPVIDRWLEENHAW